MLGQRWANTHFMVGPMMADNVRTT